MELIKFLFEHWLITLAFIWMIFSGIEVCIAAFYKGVNKP